MLSLLSTQFNVNLKGKKKQKETRRMNIWLKQIQKHIS